MTVTFTSAAVFVALSFVGAYAWFRAMFDFGGSRGDLLKVMTRLVRRR